MSKIRYPDKREVNRQVEMILDRSGMFEEMQSEGIRQEYTECVKEKTMRPFIKSAVLIVASIAVVAGTSIVLKYNTITSTNSSEPMTNVIENDTINTTGITVNDQISIDLIGEGDYMVMVTGEGKNIAKGKRSYVTPTVHYKGQEVTAITDFYSQKIKEIEEASVEKYRGIEDGVVLSLVQSANDIPIRITYNCNNVIGISLKNTDVVTIFESYTETAQIGNETTNINDIYGNNFNVTTGERITLSDLFTDETAGVAQLEELLLQQIRNTHSSDTVSDAITTTQDVTTYVSDGNWYFGNNGITICCNQLSEEETQYQDMVYSNSLSESYVIPYESLTYLKSEYDKS